MPGGQYTDKAKAAIQTMLDVPAKSDLPEVPVKEVQVNGISILDASGVANIPLARENILGAVAMKPYGAFGIQYADANYNICITRADEANIKAGAHNYRPIVPSNLHIAVFYGLAKAAGSDEKNSLLPLGQYTDAAKAAIRAMLDVPSSSDIPSVPVEDVQINGSSIVNEGIANIPIVQSRGQTGAVRINYRGLTFHNDPFDSSLPKVLGIDAASLTACKQGTSWWDPLTPQVQHAAAFYGLAEAAGDTTQSQSSNVLGQYTDEAKAAIRTMFGLDDASIIDIVQTGLPAVEGVLW